MPSIGFAKEGCFFKSAQSYGWQANQPGERGLFIIRIPSYGWQDMYYTYVIESLSRSDQRYIGHTADLRQRIADHNAGKCPHTSKFVPWKIKLYVAFETIEQAQHFERYLKSGSGHVFAKRHFWSQGSTLDS